MKRSQAMPESGEFDASVEVVTRSPGRTNPSIFDLRRI